MYICLVYTKNRVIQMIHAILVRLGGEPERISLVQWINQNAKDKASEKVVLSALIGALETAAEFHASHKSFNDFRIDNIIVDENGKYLALDSSLPSAVESESDPFKPPGVVHIPPLDVFVFADSCEAQLRNIGPPLHTVLVEMAASAYIDFLLSVSAKSDIETLIKQLPGTKPPLTDNTMTKLVNNIVKYSASSLSSVMKTLPSLVQDMQTIMDKDVASNEIYEEQWHATMRILIQGAKTINRNGHKSTVDFKWALEMIRKLEQ